MDIYSKIELNRNLIVGVGSALIDILAQQDNAFLAETGALKGGMIYKESEYIDQILAKMSSSSVITSGGSACNTVTGIGCLGGRARFIGKCGKDQLAQIFREHLQKQHVESCLFEADLPTGRVLSIITPDAQRSMITCLGASCEMRPEDLTADCFDGAAVVHIEGYLVFNRELIEAALNTAKAAGAKISLDLASYNVVEQSRDFLPSLVKRYVDILIANEDEALAYTGILDEKQALAAMAADANIAVLKTGARGSLIAYNGKIRAIAPHGSGAVVDTTGAGDLWAAGFLYGLVNHWPLSKCGDLGSKCGYEVCQVMGAHISQQRWRAIQERMEA